LAQFVIFYIQTIKQTTKKIQTMKATMKTKRFAYAGFAAMAILTMSSFAPAHAAITYTDKVGNEIREAEIRLENYSRVVEEAISYFVPVMTETTEAYFEAEVAELRLEEAVNSIENMTRYVSPAVNEDFEDLELKEAYENLEKTNRLIGETLRYEAPSVER
jgi:hypothetical protein